MKILALVGHAYGGRGGIAQYNRDLFGAVARTGGGQVVILPRLAPLPVTTPTGVRQVRAREGRMAYSLAAGARALRDRPDVVFCGHLYMAPLAALIARLAGSRLVMQMHGIEAWPRPSRAIRAAVERSDLILCVSRHTRAAVLGWAMVPPERAVVLPNTVGSVFSPGDGSALRAALGLEGKRVLLTVGRLDPRERYKGHDRIIAALPSLVASGLDAAYVVVGEGEDRARLEQLADAAAVRDRVTFLGGVDTARLVEAYRMADLFVMPSTGEGFGIAFLEAMASGTPALGLADSGALDALADGQLGITVGNTDLARGIAEGITSGTRGHALAAKVRARFGAEAFASGVSAALARIAA